MLHLFAKANNHRCCSSLVQHGTTIKYHRHQLILQPTSALQSQAWMNHGLTDSPCAEKDERTCQPVPTTLEFMESYCKQKWQRISSQGLSQINCGLLAAQGRTRGTKNPAKWPVHFRTPGPRYVYFIFISLKFKITQNTKKRSACQCISWASYAHRSEWCLMTLIAMRLGSCASPKTWRLYPHV